MPKILVLTDTHPNEKKASRFGDSLRERPIPNVDTEIANVEAYRQGLREVDLNLMAAYPGNPNSRLYEERRAAELVALSQEYDIVADIHSVREYPRDDTVAIIDKERGVSPRVLGMFGQIGVKRVVACTGIGITGHAQNAFGIEMAADFDPERLRRGLDTLASGQVAPRRPSDFEWFTLVGDLQVSQLDPRTIPKKEFDTLEGFTAPIASPKITSLVGQKACLMTWARGLNEKGYWAELVEAAPTPSARSWPRDT